MTQDLQLILILFQAIFLQDIHWFLSYILVVQTGIQNISCNKSNMKKSKVQESPGILCSGRRISQSACMDKNCSQPAFVCPSKNKCTCRDAHGKSCLFVETVAIIKNLNGKIISTKPLEQCVEARFNKIIESMQKLKQETLSMIRDKFEYWGLRDEEKEFMETIKSGKVKQITGSRLWQAYLDIEADKKAPMQVKNSVDEITKMFSRFDGYLRMPFDDIKQITDQLAKYNPVRIYTEKVEQPTKKVKVSDTTQPAKNVKASKQVEVSKKAIVQKPIQTSKQQTSNSVANYYTQIIKSIVGQDENNKFNGSSIITASHQTDKIISFFGYYLPKKFVKLFKASQKQFSASQFHKICDGQVNTLVLCKTEFNKKLGGFTPIPWGTGDNSKTDPSGMSFTFSLSLNEKFILQSKEPAVFHSSGGWFSSQYGPVFGSKQEFGIIDKANSNECSFKPNGSYFNPKFKTYEHYLPWAFTGNQSKSNYNNCKLVEWEVWKVFF